MWIIKVMELTQNKKKCCKWFELENEKTKILTLSINNKKKLLELLQLVKLSTLFGKLHHQNL